MQEHTAMVFPHPPLTAADPLWHRLRAAHYLPEVMQGMAFKDGLRVEQDAA